MDFKKINIYNVNLISLRNEIKRAKSTDELIILYGKVIEIEKEVLYEKVNPNNKLIEKKKSIENTIDKIKRTLRNYENQLRDVKNQIEYRQNYKKILELRMEALSREYAAHIKSMD